MDSFQSSRFEQQIAAALANVRKVLDVTRNPQLPSEVQHKYEDKYSLVTKKKEKKFKKKKRIEKRNILTSENRRLWDFANEKKKKRSTKQANKFKEEMRAQLSPPKKQFLLFRWLASPTPLWRPCSIVSPLWGSPKSTSRPWRVGRPLAQSLCDSRVKDVATSIERSGLWDQIEDKWAFGIKNK